MHPSLGPPHRRKRQRSMAGQQYPQSGLGTVISTYGRRAIDYLRPTSSSAPTVMIDPNQEVSFSGVDYLPGTSISKPAITSYVPRSTSLGELTTNGKEEERYDANSQYEEIIEEEGGAGGESSSSSLPFDRYEEIIQPPLEGLKARASNGDMSAEQQNSFKRGYEKRNQQPYHMVHDDGNITPGVSQMDEEPYYYPEGGKAGSHELHPPRTLSAADKFRENRLYMNRKYFDESVNQYGGKALGGAALAAGGSLAAYGIYRAYKHFKQKKRKREGTSGAGQAPLPPPGTGGAMSQADAATGGSASAPGAPGGGGGGGGSTNPVQVEKINANTGLVDVVEKAQGPDTNRTDPITPATGSKQTTDTANSIVGPEILKQMTEKKVSHEGPEAVYGNARERANMGKGAASGYEFRGPFDYPTYPGGRADDSLTAMGAWRTKGGNQSSLWYSKLTSKGKEAKRNKYFKWSTKGGPGGNWRKLTKEDMMNVFTKPGRAEGGNFTGVVAGARFKDMIHSQLANKEKDIALGKIGAAKTEAAKMGWVDGQGDSARKKRRKLGYQGGESHQ